MIVTGLNGSGGSFSSIWQGGAPQYHPSSWTCRRNSKRYVQILHYQYLRCKKYESSWLLDEVLSFRMDFHFQKPPWKFVVFQWTQYAVIRPTPNFGLSWEGLTSLPSLVAEARKCWFSVTFTVLKFCYKFWWCIVLINEIFFQHDVDFNCRYYPYFIFHNPNPTVLF